MQNKLLENLKSMHDQSNSIYLKANSIDLTQKDEFTTVKKENILSYHVKFVRKIRLNTMYNEGLYFKHILKYNDNGEEKLIVSEEKPAKFNGDRILLEGGKTKWMSIKNVEETIENTINTFFNVQRGEKGRILSITKKETALERPKWLYFNNGVINVELNYELVKPEMDLTYYTPKLYFTEPSTINENIISRALKKKYEEFLEINEPVINSLYEKLTLAQRGKVKLTKFELDEINKRIDSFEEEKARFFKVRKLKINLVDNNTKEVNQIEKQFLIKDAVNQMGNRIVKALVLRENNWEKGFITPTIEFDKRRFENNERSAFIKQEGLVVDNKLISTYELQTQTQNNTTPKTPKKSKPSYKTTSITLVDDVSLEEISL